MTALAIFAATFVLVFALGFQSLAVNRGQYKTAFINSLLIGSSNFIILKAVPSTSEVIEVVAYLTGGPLGIVFSMWVHARTLGRGNQLK